MDFKERFKGRTSIMNKEGVIGIVSSSGRPIDKTQTNFQPTQTSNVSMKKENVNMSKNYQASPMLQSGGRTANVEYPEPDSLSPKMMFNPMQKLTPNRSQPIQPMIKDNPFLVNNPYPSIEPSESNASLRYPGNNDYDAPKSYSYQGFYPNGGNNQFNPNNFYNQQVQYRNTQQIFPTPNQQYPMTSEGRQFMQYTNTFHRQNFEHLSNQNKQMRMNGEAMMNLGNSPNGRYEQYDNNMMDPNQFPSNYSRPIPMTGNSQNLMPTRELYSNPNPFNYPKGIGMNTSMEGNNFYGDRSYSAQNNIIYDRSKTISPGKESFKPYSLKEYKDLEHRVQSNRGGLGANVNTGEWQKKKEKLDKMTNFSQNVKLYNSQKNTMDNLKKTHQEEPKEKSKRDIAHSFAKNIPRPKPKKPDEEITPLRSKQNDIEYNNPTNYENTYSLDMLERQHMQYMNQIEKIK
jgi:hypothetical protein